MDRRNVWTNNNNKNKENNVPNSLENIEIENSLPVVSWGNYKNVANRLSNQGYNVNTPTIDLSLDNAYQLLLEAEAGRVTLPRKPQRNISEEIKVANNIAKNALSEYYFFVDKFFVIFKRVCEFREEETELEKKARVKKKQYIKEGLYGQAAHSKAYREILQYKKDKAAEKKSLLEDLNNLSLELDGFLEHHSNSNNFNKIFDKTDILKVFLKINPTCRRYITKSKKRSTFDGLRDYLEKTSKRANVDNKNTNKNR